LNCGEIDWVNLHALNDSDQDAFLNFTVNHGYSQLIEVPTRNNNVLDVVLTNEPLSICDVYVEQPFGSSDHCQVYFKVFAESLKSNSDVTANRTCRMIRNWKHANYGEIVTKRGPWHLIHHHQIVVQNSVRAYCFTLLSDAACFVWSGRSGGPVDDFFNNRI